MILKISSIFVIFFIISVIPAYAEIQVSSTNLEETTILSVSNESDEQITEFRVWVTDAKFKSLKTEVGWIGQLTPVGTIVFKSTSGIPSGESVKFGVITDVISPPINWKAIGINEKQLQTGKVISEDLAKPIENLPPIQQDSENPKFWTIPEKLNVSSSFRVVGENFAASDNFDFYIDSQKIGSLSTDEDGKFVTTMKIPDNQKTGNIQLKINDLSISKNIGAKTEKDYSNDTPKTNPSFQLNVPSSIKIGETLKIDGTDRPDSAVSVRIIDNLENHLTAQGVNTDGNGKWNLSYTIPIQNPLGVYTVLVSGSSDATRQFDVKSERDFEVAPYKLKYDVGDLLQFNGTGIPHTKVNLYLENPLGKEVNSDVMITGQDGAVFFEHQTNPNSIQGTYTLGIAHDEKTEFFYVGVGELPSVPIDVTFDKISYRQTDTAQIQFTGNHGDVIKMLILDPNEHLIVLSPHEDPEKQKAEKIITISEDGKASDSLKLSGFDSGMYTVIISRGSQQNSETFAVGMDTGTGDFEITSSKNTYLPGQNVLILGDAKKNTQFVATLYDEEGDAVRAKTIFSNREGKISENSFRIPTGANSGIWSIIIQSGTNSQKMEIEIVPSEINQLIINISQIEIGINDALQIEILGAEQTTQIEIISKDGTVIEKIEFPASSGGEVKQPWLIPDELEPGIYTFKVKDAWKEAEATFDISN